MCVIFNLTKVGPIFSHPCGGTEVKHLPFPSQQCATRWLWSASVRQRQSSVDDVQKCASLVSVRERKWCVISLVENFPHFNNLILLLHRKVSAVQIVRVLEKL